MHLSGLEGNMSGSAAITSNLLYNGSGSLRLSIGKVVPHPRGSPCIQHNAVYDSSVIYTIVI